MRMHTHITKSESAFQGLRTGKKLLLLLMKTERIDQPTGYRPRRAPHADSLFRQCVVNLYPKEH